MQESPPQNVVAFPLGCLLEIGIKLSTWSYFVFPPKFISWTCPLFIKYSSKRFVSTNISLCGCRVTSVTFLPLSDTEIEAQVATWCGQGFDAHPLSASVPFLITSRRASLTTRVSGPGDEKSVSTPLFYCCCVCVCVCVCVRACTHTRTCILVRSSALLVSSVVSSSVPWLSLAWESRQHWLDYMALTFLYMCKTVDMEFKARLRDQVSLGSSRGSAVY